MGWNSTFFLLWEQRRNHCVAKLIKFEKDGAHEKKPAVDFRAAYLVRGATLTTLPEDGVKPILRWKGGFKNIR